jgi:membrane protease YdiL (CAAX protease family)
MRIAMMKYIYKPVRFYLTVFLFTWSFWFTAAIVSRIDGQNAMSTIFLLLGLLTPPITALCTVLTSKSAALKKDLKEKLVGLFRVDIKNIVLAIIVFLGIIVLSILLSTLFGQSLAQLSFTGGFSFSITGVPTLFTLILAAFLEELGWRGYAEDSIAFYYSWWKESLIFGVVWSLWHLPLFFVIGTYQYNILQESPWYMVNFFISGMPLGFYITWIYVKSSRSIFTCIVFHFFLNFFQEQIAMTQITKCVETFVIFIVAGIVVLANRELFFEKRHIGNLLKEEEE